jgi:hypothetical protein
MTEPDLAAELGWLQARLELVLAHDALPDQDLRLDASAIITAWLTHRTNLLRN